MSTIRKRAGFLSLVLAVLMLAGCGRQVVTTTTRAAARTQTEAETTAPETTMTETESLTETETETKEESTEESSEETETETEAETVISENPAHNYVSTLPVLYLDGNFGALAADKTLSVTCSYELLGEGEDYTGTLTAHGRGHTSWAIMPKKGYKLKLDSKQNLYGMGKSKHWVLISCYSDTTYMRNYLASQLGGAFGLPVMDGMWVDVVVNGSYYGLYYLSEQVRVEKSRIDIDACVEDVAENIAEMFVKMNANTSLSWIPEDNLKKMLLEDMTWISTDTFTYADVTFRVSDYYPFDKDKLLTCGYLVDVDGYFDNLSNFFTTNLNRPISIVNLDYANNYPEMISYVANIFNTFETALINGANTGSFTASYNGTTVTPYDMIDLDSMVAYFWVQEIFMNADGGYRSFYLYKDADQDGTLSKFYVGPIWDMDYSSGGYRDGDRSYPTTGWDYNSFIPYSMTANNWGKYLTKDPVFRKAAYNFYVQHRGDITAMIDSIDGIHAKVAAAAQVDASVWGLWRYDNNTETQVLKDWLNERMAWLDSVMVSYDSFVGALQ